MDFKQELERLKTFIIVNKLDVNNPGLLEGVNQQLREIADEEGRDECIHEFDPDEGGYCLNCGLHVTESRQCDPDTDPER